MSKRKDKKPTEKGGKKSNKKKDLTNLIQRFFTKHSTEVYSHKQVCDELAIKELRKSVYAILKTQTNNEFLREVGHGVYKRNQHSQAYEGEVDITNSGSGYVLVDELDNDVFIHQRNLNNALSGDIVRVALNGRGRKSRPEGVILEVLKRERTQFVGTINIHDGNGVFVSNNPRSRVSIQIPKEKLNGAQHKDKVLAKITVWAQSAKYPFGEVLEVLKSKSANDIEAISILVNHGIEYKFPQAVLDEAELIGMKLDETEVKNRRDFRNILTFTIDPVDAKDFDDALSYRKLENGHYEIGVHIADVSHYVRPNSALDREALMRSNSVYMVDRVVPMLPEQLSNMACSLRPNEDKFCFSAVFEMDDNGKIFNEWFGKTVIHSDRRMTYEEAQEVIEGKADELENEILFMDKIAKIYRNQRIKKGAISFESEEMRFQLDEQGNPVRTYVKISKDANKLIEEFMLLANRKVGEFIGKRKKGEDFIPFLYRIHDKPSMDKIMLFRTFIDKFGYDLDFSHPDELAVAMNKLLDDVRYENEYGIIQTMAIRSMAKAVYDTTNIGHYGLAFEYYTHFTSPIRRYADLIVHRILQDQLTKQPHKYGNELNDIAKRISRNERKAVDAERDSNKYFQALLMKENVGKTYDGTISGLADFGMFVRITENACEGMIALTEIPGDRFYFDVQNFYVIGANTEKEYNFGDAVRVKVIGVDMFKKQINLELLV
ncbi:MAG TPA: ribonuclease R [Crocinitomicaceae bacterium]|nr:ribonuclease R [Crocinitomicaceae bacterium]